MQLPFSQSYSWSWKKLLKLREVALKVITLPTDIAVPQGCFVMKKVWNELRSKAVKVHHGGDLDGFVEQMVLQLCHELR
ncbi:hypothetical protein J1N35_045524 [Gossypium stocksii]|uniref:Uncharacterized protein n=1 Tax=Gossypium stocksii TaxID=47602 RepID=A0A9D3ZH49_9ROSI|nr:hypothetical protein J1N35_045524 [Gossypium stocksii]